MQYIFNVLFAFRKEYSWNATQTINQNTHLYGYNTLTNHQLTCTSICVTETIFWRTINERGQVFVLQRQYVDEPSTDVDKYLCYIDSALTNHQLTWTSICYRDNTLTNHQLTWTSICVTWTILWRTINLCGQVFVLHGQYFDEPSTCVEKYLCYRDNTLMNHLTWTSICCTQTMLWRTINLRGQVFVVHGQCFDEPSTYVDKYLCYMDNTLTNHLLTWTSICVTWTILWRTIYLRGQVFVLQGKYFVVIPEHCLPPYRGAGFEQDLVHNCLPPPHVREHFTRDVQGVNSPSTYI